MRGFGWPRRVRVTARVGGKAVKSVRTGPRGRFAMRVTPAAAAGRVRMVMRAGKRRLAVRAVRRRRGGLPRRRPAGPAVGPAVAGTGPAGVAARAPTDAHTHSDAHSGAGTTGAPAGARRRHRRCRRYRLRARGGRHGDDVRQQATSDLLAAVDAVLALGDIQYENATTSKFASSYNPTWGRFKPITYPVPGNHEYSTGGAADYFTISAPRPATPPRATTPSTSAPGT